MSRENTSRRRFLTGVAGTTALATIPLTTSGAGRSKQRSRKLFATAQEILEDTNDLKRFYSFLESKSFSTAHKRGEVTVQSQVTPPGDGVSTEYQNKSSVELDIGLSWDTYNDTYFGQANWHWTNQTLSPKDVIGLTYKENSWSVPKNGYNSSKYCSIDSDARSANGYAWRYEDDNDNSSPPRAYNYASLEMNPYDPSISESDRTIWMVYTATSSPYPGWIEGVAVGYGVLSVDVSPNVKKVTWIEDNSGDELKISQANAQPQ
jgi:hypothetical protein